MLARLKQMGRSGSAFSFLVAAFGFGVTIFSSVQLGFGTKAEVGPGIFPCVVGMILVATGIISGISTMRAEGGGKAGRAELSKNSMWRVVFMILSFTAWLLLTNYLGYIPATFLVAIAMGKTVGLEGWMRTLVLALAITASLYLLFDILFYVDLPRGILE